MIRFALACQEGHEFESWFPSGASYEAQSERGLVTCPVCGSDRVSKQLMAPAVGRKGGPSQASGPSEPSGEPAPTSPQPVAVLSEREQAVRAMLRAVREHVTRNADYVGPSFAEQARKMHYGEIAHRSIYGETDPAEARALAEEGVEVHPLPPAPDDRN